MEASVFETATTFRIYSDKPTAVRVCKRLRDHNIVAGLRGTRGQREVFGYAPTRLTDEDVRALCDKFAREVV